MNKAIISVATTPKALIGVPAPNLRNHKNPRKNIRKGKENFKNMDKYLGGKFVYT